MDFKQRFIRVLAILVLTFSATAFSDAAVPEAEYTDSECLVSVIHYEAGGEPLSGKRAVYDVVMNRAKALQKTICEVVSEPKQFSWFPYKPMLAYGGEMREMLERVIAHGRILNNEKNFFSGKTPSWAINMECRTIFNHNFCKEKDEVRQRNDYSPFSARQ